MAFNFPSNPNLNDTYSFNGKTWRFNGNAWQYASDQVSITVGNVIANVVTANSFIGDGSQLTGLPAGYTDSNVETLLSGNITIGNISVTGTIDGYATTGYVDSEVANLVASAPSTLDTLNELASALGNDPNLSTTLTSLIGNNSANITTLQGNITSIELDITNLEANIPANLQSNVTTLEGNIVSIESDVSTLQGNITSIELDITNLEANIPANLQSNVTTLESDVSTLQGNITTLESDIANLEANIPANLQSNVTTLESDVSTLQGNITTLDNQVANLNYYDDTNVTTFLSDIGSNSITTTGNITANYFIGDGSQLTGLPAGYTDSNVESVLSGNITVGNIAVTGTIDGYATTSYVDSEVANLVASAPSTLDTLNELATALGNDPNLSTTLTSLIGNNSSNITVLQGNITTLESDIANLEANIPANLQSNVTTLEGNIVSIESDVSTLQGNITTLDNQVANLNYYDDTNVTTFLSNIGSNSIATTGNITANYFIGDGSALTGINAGANVTFSNSAPISPSAGDVWIDSVDGIQYIYFDDGDSSQWVDMQSTIQNVGGGGSLNEADVATFLGNLGSNVITTTGDITANSFIGDGSQLTGLPASYSDSNVESYLTAVTGNIIPSANITYDLGSETNRWRDIYLANSTIYLGEANISAQGGALTLPSTVSIGNATLDASSGNLALPSSVSIGNVTLDASSGNLALPANSSIGGSTVATPRVASIDYGGDDTAANVAGGQTIGIVGSGFAAGATVYLDSQTISVVSFVNSNRLEFTAPAKSTGSYSLYVINADGGTGIYVPGIQYSGVPAWSSPSAGSLGSVYETKTVSNTFVANSDSTVSYSLYSGDLPPGTTLDSNTGILSGTANLTNGTTTTYNFTVRATDEENQDTDRSFSLTINVDEISWNSPTDGNVIQGYEFSSYSSTLDATSAAGDGITYGASGLPTNISISGNTLSGNFGSIGNTSSTLTATGNTTTRVGNIAVTFQSLEDVVTWSSPTDGGNVEIIVNESSTTNLIANSAGGNDIVYTANTLPNGLSLSGNTITGTPTAVANTSVALTATANVTARSSVITVNFAITLPLGDQYFNQTTLLLNADDNTFITDASDNNFTITPAGDTRPSAFSPYNGGWSNYFDGSGDWLSGGTTAGNFGTGDFTIEYWAKNDKSQANPTYFPQLGTLADGTPAKTWRFGTMYNTAGGQNGYLGFAYHTGSTFVDTFFGTTNYNDDQWHHFALTRSSGTVRAYVDGTQVGSSVTITQDLSSSKAITIGREGYTPTYYKGYISNIRLIQGTALYTSNFTPLTAPLTAISGTSLLTCQSNRFIDNSTNNFTITRNGDVKVLSFGPFATDYRQDPESYSVYFDGIGDWLSLNSSMSIPSSTSFTIEGWFYWNAIPATYSMIISDNNGNSSKYIAYNVGASTLDVQTGTSAGTVAYCSFTPVVGTWYHLAFVRNGTAITIYVNGVAQSMTTPTQTNAFLDNGSVTYVGRWAGTTPYESNWHISNFRVVNGSAVYTSNFTPPTEPLTAVTNTTLLTCQSSTIVDNSSNAFTITANGNSQPRSANPFDGRPITYSGYFENSQLSIASNAALDFGTGDFTIEGWFSTTKAEDGSNPLNIAVYIGTVNGSAALGLGISASAIRVRVSSNILNITSLSLSNFTHIAFVRSSGVLYVYVNGSLAGNVNLTTNLSSTGGCIIARQSTTYSFYGYISNLRIVKGTAVYTSAFTPPTASLTAISGTSLLTCQSPAFIDNSTNAIAITVNGDTTVSTNNPLGYVPITNTAITDTTGSALYVSDATDDCQIADDDNLSFTSTDDFTLECWVYHLSHRTYNYFFSKGLTATREYGFGTTSSEMRFYWKQGSDQVISHSYSFLLNTWYHLVYTQSNGTMRFFINGDLVKEQAWSGTVTNTSQPAWIGTFLNYRNIAHSFHGYLSDLRFTKGLARYTSSFTPPTAPVSSDTDTQLLTHQNRIGYNNSQPIDESGIKNVITRNGNASAGSFSPHVPSGWSGYFDGTGDYLNLTATSDIVQWWTTDYTLECWVYVNNFSTWLTNSNPCLIGNMSASGSTNYWSFGPNTDGTVRFKYYNGSSVFVNSTETVSLNTWTHLALVKDSNGIRVYVNGVGTSSTPVSGTPQSDSTFVIGQHLATSINGYVSNIRIVKGTAVYTSNFTPSTEPLEPIANTSLLTLRTNSFVDEGPNRFAITRNGNTKITPFSPFKPHTVAPDSHSVYFDGTGDYLSIPDNSAFDLGTGDFTLELWANFQELSTTTTTGDDFLSGNGSGDFDFAYVGSALRLGRYGIAWDSTFSFTPNLNQWYHIAYTRSSGTLRVFVDGSLIGSGSNTNSYNVTGTVLIGIDGDLIYRAMKGYISNLRLIKGTAVYTSNFTPPTAPLTAIANTSLLTCQSPTAIDNSTNDFAITVNGNAQPSKYNPFGETITTGVEYSPASHGGSVYFDGTGDYLSIANNVVFNPGLSDFCIEGWYYITAFASPTNLWGFNNGSGATAKMSSYVDSNGTLHFDFTLAGGVSLITSAAGTVKLNTWTHIAAVRNSGVFTLYVDGVSVGTSSTSINLTGITQPWYIGYVGEGYGTPLTGYISSFRYVKGTALYTSAFVPPQAPVDPVPGTTLLTCNNNASIQDKTGRNVLETVGNARVVNGVKKYGTGAMYFDGTGDWFEWKSSTQGFGTGDYTVEFWLNLNSLASINGIFQHGQDNGAFAIHVNTNGTVRVLENSVASLVDSSISLSTGTWYHIAVVQEGSSGTLYIDGISRGTFTKSTAWTFTNETSYVGARYFSSSAGQYPTNGYIDDFRITKGVARYTANFTPPTGTYTLK